MRGFGKLGLGSDSCPVVYGASGKGAGDQMMEEASSLLSGSDCA